MELTRLLIQIVVAVVVMFLDLSSFFILIQMLTANSTNRWILAIQHAGKPLVAQWQGVFKALWCRTGICISQRLSLAICLAGLLFVRGVVELLTYGLRGS